MNNRFNVAVIGGGVVGGMILRELSRYDLSVCLLEKEDDVAKGSSRANTGIVHGGFDAVEGSNKAKYNVQGCALMPKVTQELGVKYQNNGTLVVAFSDEDLKMVQTLYQRGIKNGVTGLKILSQTELFEKEPNVNKTALGGLYCQSAGIVCPYELTISAIGNAMDNGAELITDFEVVKIDKDENYTLTSADGKVVTADVVINVAGMFADKVANLIGDASFKISARKGEYILLDKCHSGFLNHTLFFCPGKGGKGIVVTHTVDGNILLGPTADEIDDKTDVSTTARGLNTVKQKATEMCASLPFYDTITSFAGSRAYCDRNDFIIEPSSVLDTFINVAGIESPGLTASPAIALKVVELVGEKITLNKKASFNPYRKADYFFKNLSIEEKNQIIEKDSTYGKIICRCEEITLGEILRAIRENPKATTIDGIKRRTRAGMGRCQGGFCQPTIAKIIADELNIPLEEVQKGGKNSNVLVGKSK